MKKTSIEDEFKELLISSPTAYASNIDTIECGTQAQGLQTFQTYDAFEHTQGLRPGNSTDISKVPDGFGDFFGRFDTSFLDSDGGWG